MRPEIGLEASVLSHVTTQVFIVYFNKIQLHVIVKVFTFIPDSSLSHRSSFDVNPWLHFSVHFCSDVSPVDLVFYSLNHQTAHRASSIIISWLQSQRYLCKYMLQYLKLRARNIHSSPSVFFIIRSSQSMTTSLFGWGHKLVLQKHNLLPEKYVGHSLEVMLLPQLPWKRFLPHHFNTCCAGPLLLYV